MKVAAKLTKKQLEEENNNLMEENEFLLEELEALKEELEGFQGEGGVGELLACFMAAEDRRCNSKMVYDRCKQRGLHYDAIERPFRPLPPSGDPMFDRYTFTLVDGPRVPSFPYTFNSKNIPLPPNVPYVRMTGVV